MLFSWLKLNYKMVLLQFYNDSEEQTICNDFICAKHDLSKKVTTGIDADEFVYVC